MMNKVYLGVDPGRSKIGLALVTENEQILKLHIAETKHIVEELRNFIQCYCPVQLVLGNGTNSDNIAQLLAQILPQLPLAVIEEAHSTEQARGLYWQCNPPRGWRRLLPLGLLVPPVPLDDYAAVILVRRFLEGKK